MASHPGRSRVFRDTPFVVVDHGNEHDQATVQALASAKRVVPGFSANQVVGIGEVDVHHGAIGCGVDEGTMVKVIGTTTCDCAVVSAEKPVADIPGIRGIEAGQSAVGFHPDFKTAMTGLKEVSYRPHPENQERYGQLFGLYLSLHDAFGGVTRSADLSHVMKTLLAIKSDAHNN